MITRTTSSKQIEMESQQIIKKLIEVPLNNQRVLSRYVLDQNELQNLWNRLKDLHGKDELQRIIKPFYDKPNLDSIEATICLIELLEYLYSKNEHFPLLSALNESKITDFLKMTALSKNQRIKDKSLYCLFTVSNKVNQKDQINSILKLKKELILIHDIVCVDNSESLYFSPPPKESKQKPKPSLSFEEFFNDQSQELITQTNQKEQAEEKKISWADDFFNSLQDRQKQHKELSPKQCDPTKFEYPKPFSQNVKNFKDSVSPPSNYKSNNLNPSVPRNPGKDYSTVRNLEEIDNYQAPANPSNLKPQNIIKNSYDNDTFPQKESNSGHKQPVRRQSVPPRDQNFDAKEEMKVNNLTLEELLAFKKVLCGREECASIEIKYPVDFLGENELMKCPRYHNHTDKKRLPFSKRDPKKSSYQHDQLCGRCLRKPEVHGSRCKLAGNYFEAYYHPYNYKLLECKNSSCETDSIRNKYCPLYHNFKEKQEWDKVLMSDSGFDRRNSEFRLKLIGDSSDSSDHNSDTLGRKIVFQTAHDKAPAKQQLQSPDLKDQFAQKYQENVRSPELDSEKGLQRNFLGSDSPRLFKKRPSSQRSDSSSKSKKRSTSPVSATNHNHATKLANSKTESNKATEFFQPSPTLANTEKTILPDKSFPENKLLNDYTDYELAKTRKYIYKNTKIKINGDEAEENKFLEFKNYKGPAYTELHWDEILKAVGGFLNAEGGMLLIGVDDDGRVKGSYMGKKGYDEFKCKFISSILSSISPKIDDTFYTIDKISVIHEGQVLNEVNRYKSLLIEIKIKKGGNSIYFVRKENNSVCYQRFDASTRVLRGDQINELIMSRMVNVSGNR